MVCVGQTDPRHTCYRKRHVPRYVSSTGVRVYRKIILFQSVKENMYKSVVTSECKTDKTVPIKFVSDIATALQPYKTQQPFYHGVDDESDFVPDVSFTQSTIDYKLSNLQDIGMGDMTDTASLSKLIDILHISFSPIPVTCDNAEDSESDHLEWYEDPDD